MLVMKRLSDAVRDGDPIRAIIRGSAVGQDGRSNGLIAPNGNAQIHVLRSALQQAGIEPPQLSYIETHGTGTVLGDPIELRALKAVLLSGRDHDQPCAIGAVKTNIGHLEAAAGIAGLLKVVLALERQAIPPNLHYRSPNPHCSLEGTPLSIPTELVAWRTTDMPRVAGVSSFGFGGTLAHVVAQEVPELPLSGPNRPWQLVTLSARTPTALDRMSDMLAGRLLAKPDLSSADVAYTHQSGRNHFAARRMLVCRNEEEAARGLTERKASHMRIAKSGARGAAYVFMFPGQGAQQFGMAREFIGTSNCFGNTSMHVPPFSGSNISSTSEWCSGWMEARKTLSSERWRGPVLPSLPSSSSSTPWRSCGCSTVCNPTH